MQKLDLYHPKASSPPYQLLVYIHGGGWTSGDKNNAIHLPETRELLKRGYAVASINYRLAPVHRWPAQIEDCICAIHFLRAHSQVYQIETQKIGVFGTSAGGHLASLLGTMDETIFLQAGDSSQGYSSRVQAVVNMFGPIDFTAGDMADKVTQHQSIFGATSPDDPVLEQASPITHVSADDPPFLILHGEEDGLVPLRQSRSFYERLLHAGVPVELVIVKNAGHGFKSTGEEIQPSRMDIAGIVADFFDKIFVTAQPYQF